MDDKRLNQVGRALDKLKAKWGLRRRAQVIERLLNEHDATILQIIEREDKLKEKK